MKSLLALALLAVALPVAAQQPATPAPAPEQTVTAPEAKKESNKAALPCLIVGSNHGLNKAIGYALGGVTGILLSGDRYEYRDNVNVDAKFLKPSYKNKDLKQMMINGIHIVIVNKKATPPEVVAARRECSAEDVVPQQTSEGVRPIVTQPQPKP